MSATKEYDIFKVHADFCKCLASEKRLRILWLLHEGEQSVTELAEQIGIPVANVSQHLRILKNFQAVGEKKIGKQVFYHITNEKFIKGCRLIREGIIENQLLKTESFSDVGD